MFERYTEKARKVIVASQREAQHFRHNYIGTEHLLAALFDEPGPHREVLVASGLTHDLVRTMIGNICGVGDSEPNAQIPFTPRSKECLEVALREALSLGHNYIGPEHLLLGLVRQNEGTGARLIYDFGPDTHILIREMMIAKLRGEKERTVPPELDTIAAVASRMIDELTIAAAEQALERLKLEAERLREHLPSSLLPIIDWDKLTLADTRTLADLLRKAAPD